MKKLYAFAAILGLILTQACGNTQDAQGNEPNEENSLTLELVGDSTIYGLVCDGTNDTLLIFLPVSDISANPDTLNILNATRKHKIFGRPKVGDKIAIVRSSKDSTVADIVIDTNHLLGTWCYQVTPTLRKRADITEEMHKKLLKEMPDSIRDSLMAPREYGIQIKGDNAARSLGRRLAQQNEDSPVEYPRAKRYSIWNLHNGQLLLTETMMDSTGLQHITGTDTAQFVMLRRDTLVLRFSDRLQGYYRKVENDSL